MVPRRNQGMLTKSSIERFHGCTNGRFQLDHIEPFIKGLVVNNYFNVQRTR